MRDRLLGLPFRARLGVAVALLGWLAGDSLRAWPHYLAYFQPLAGGPAGGHRHLVDSSLDWGQDLPGLAGWVEDHLARDGEGSRFYLSWFGSARPDHYGLTANLPSYPPQQRRAEAALGGGTYAISASMLAGAFGPFPGAWTRAYEADYRQGLASYSRVREALGPEGDPRERLGPAERRRWDALLWRLDELRFARLCAWLRGGEPDTLIGYSVRIYRLQDADLREALGGPLPEDGVMFRRPGRRR